MENVTHVKNRLKIVNIVGMMMIKNKQLVIYVNKVFLLKIIVVNHVDLFVLIVMKIYVNNVLEIIFII